MRVVPSVAHALLLLVMSLGGFTERVNRPMVKKTSTTLARLHFDFAE
jgi:hypothetical protein